jgi:hypothetical protein
MEERMPEDEDKTVTAPKTEEPKKEDAPEEIRLTSEQLRDRLERSRTAFLRAHGFKDEDELKALKKREEERSKAEDEARRAALSREQQLQEDLQREKDARLAAERQSQQVQFEREVATVCASLGVRNYDYALFEVGRARAAATPEQPLDIAAWLQAQIEAKPAMRAALGLEAPPQSVTSPVTTTVGGQVTSTAPRVTGPGAPKTAFDLDQAAWQAKREALGIG